MFKKVLLFLVIAWGAYAIWQLAFSRDLFPSSGKKITLKLNQHPLTVFAFSSKRPETAAIILFGSGDGGWTTFEEAIAQACQNQGYELIGIDSRAYAESDYDLATLQADFGIIAQEARAPFDGKAPPLIVGGYSMGAAQAVAVAGGPHPPPGLVGIVLVDMLSRGRYGLHSADQLNILPTGAGTFGVADFAPALTPLRIIQWHAEDDFIDSLAWLNSLAAPHRKFIFPGTGHLYQTNREDFIRQLVDSIGWILDSKTNALEAAKPALSHE